MMLYPNPNEPPITYNYIPALHRIADALEKLGPTPDFDALKEAFNKGVDEGRKYAAAQKDADDFIHALTTMPARPVVSPLAKMAGQLNTYPNVILGEN